MKLNSNKASPEEQIPRKDGRPIRLSYSHRKLLEKLVAAEAMGESLEGQIAVANVVLNRVKSPDFPNSVPEVIFEKWQFSSAENLDQVIPTESVKEAVSRAQKGENVVGDALFFLNPAMATNFIVPETKTFVKQIGEHYFYK